MKKSALPIILVLVVLYVITSNKTQKSVTTSDGQKKEPASGSSRGVTATETTSTITTRKNGSGTYIPTRVVRHR